MSGCRLNGGRLHRQVHHGEESLKNYLIAAIMLLLVGLSLTAGTELFDRQRAEQSALRDVGHRLTPYRDRLAASLELMVRLNQRLGSDIASNPAISSRQLQHLSQKLVTEQPPIVSVAISHKLTVFLVHPLKGNEAVLGLDFGLHPEFMGGIKRSVDSRKTIVDGPVRLLQNGRVGLIIRTPVFLPATNKHPGEFWGHVSMAVDLEGLLIGVGLLDPGHAFAVAIRNQTGRDAQMAAIFGNQRLFQQPHVTAGVAFADGNWQIGASPKLSTGYDAGRCWTIRGTGILVTLFSVFVVVYRGVLRRGQVGARPGEVISGAPWATRRQRPLRTMLLTSLLLVLPIIVGLTGWFSHRSAMRAAEQLEQQQVAELGKQIRDNVTAFFEVPRRVATFNAEQFRGGLLDPHKQDRLIRNFLLQLRQQPLLTFLSMGTSKGEYFSASRPPLGDDRALRLLEATRAGRRVMNIYRVDDANRRSTLLSVGNVNFDARTRPWFK